MSECAHTQSLSPVQLFAAPWTIACQVLVYGIFQARILECHLGVPIAANDGAGADAGGVSAGGGTELSADISTPNLLKDIASKFVAQYGTGTDNDQCLSVIDLSKMANFTTKFNAYAANFKNSDFSNIESIYNGRNSLVFGEDAYGIMDFKDFLDQAKSKFSYSTSEVESAFSGLVVSDANIYGKKYSSKKPCGINIFIATGYDIQIAKSEYGTSDTKLSNWRTLNINNGSFYSGYSY